MGLRPRAKTWSTNWSRWLRSARCARHVQLDAETAWDRRVCTAQNPALRAMRLWYACSGRAGWQRKARPANLGEDAQLVARQRAKRDRGGFGRREKSSRSVGRSSSGSAPVRVTVISACLWTIWAVRQAAGLCWGAWCGFLSYAISFSSFSASLPVHSTIGETWICLTSEATASDDPGKTSMIFANFVITQLGNLHSR